MLKRHFYYYLLKPYLPWRMRMAIRRIVARWKRQKYQAIWPINASAGRTPTGWNGWPEGKKFALVLTHDVESPVGLARCRHLAELEMELGFRSSFNFIPEGTYIVPEELRFWLVANGFEVGVHDLKHDGKLYSNHTQFRHQAQRINHYVNQWGASGFRSGFMHHHQEWLHDLNVEYDASTFDTDPFEPQPDGVGTIFPFWVPSPHLNGLGQKGTRFIVDIDYKMQGRQSHFNSISPLTSREGYVELPYTIPQDSTVYLLLQEQTGEIWRNKVDWVAGRGGMALINVHPDYLHVRSGSSDVATLTAEQHYVDWLRYLAQSYKNDYWHVLPRQMAGYVRDWNARRTPDQHP